MKKYRHWWRTNVVNIIRQYPKLKKAKEEIQQQKLTASYGYNIRSKNGASRNTENKAIMELPEQEEKILDAVDKAIREISRNVDGDEVLKIVKLVDFENYSMEEASVKLNMHRNTATSRRTRFIDAVGKYLGYL